MRTNIKTKILSILLSCFCMNFAKADNVELDNSVLINANEIVYNNSIDVVNAFGDVEVAKNNSIIWADEITYNKKQNIIIAKGNITFKDNDGNVSYGSSMEFNNDLRTGFIKSPQIKMSDSSQIAGSIAQRETPTLSSINNVVYSPCKVCEDNNNPIWQIKASKVENNEETLNVTYKNAWLEIYGTPIFYTPYLTHPDPRVTRRSGWLAPTIESSSDIGFMLRNYYYWDIKEDTDATFEVSLIDLVKTPLIGGEFRHLFKNGSLKLSGSITSGSDVKKKGEDSFKGHFFADGEFNINEHWRTGFSIKSVSHDDYFEKYDFENKDTDMLTSRAYLEGFYGDDYLALSAYNFKDLRPNIPQEQPIILPKAEYSFKGDSFLGLNTNWVSQGDILALDQKDENKELRVYNQSGIEQNYLSTFGLSLDVSADLFTRAYMIDSEDPTKKENIFSVMPQLYMLAKYPLSKNLKSGSTAIIEPVANLILAPNGVNDEDTPIQDSTILDLDYTNLFSKNRLSGVDRLEDGIRSSYGLKTSILNNNGGYYSAFIGQAYRQRENSYLFPETSSLNSKFSDIIIELQAKPNNNVNLDYSLLLDKDSLTDKKHEAYFSLGNPDLFRLKGSYLYYKEEAIDITNENNQELKLGFDSAINNYWKLSGSSTSSLGSKGDGLLKSKLGLIYTDECFSFGIIGERDLTNRKGADAATTIMFRLGLKNLGEFETPSLSTNFLLNNDNSKK
ncbi:MAG: LPS assembly protein LptD [Alphaproteobacteria bacterium]|nr:LPS assembly protein LptD [Alphaproteobacteria bacterium]